MIKTEVIADSKNEFGNRITTMVVTFPRFILAELNTHRIFSRNSASSRAIPFEKMVKSVEKNPFIPIAWQKDHKGMQGTEYFSSTDTTTIENEWLRAKDEAVIAAKILSNVGITKQLVNRLLEPFMWHTVLITATEWENFFALRCPKYLHSKATGEFRSKVDWKTFNNTGNGLGDVEPTNEIDWLKLNKGQAEIHMMALAEAMWDAMNESTPTKLKAGEWHIPFIEESKVWKYAENITGDWNLEDRYSHGLQLDIVSKLSLKIATAMCARVSYTVVGEESKEPNYDNDIKLHDRLATSGHWSPFEHCAKTMSIDEYESHFSGKLEYTETDGILINDDYLGWSGNFKGFIQYRKMFKNENII